jgi:hypothetical protein
MDLFYVYILALGITAALLIAIYLVTLVKVLKSMAFKKIFLVITMLIMANMAYLIEAYALWSLVNGDYNELAGITEPIGDFMFAEAHWLIAFYYMRLAKNMPKVID